MYRQGIIHLVVQLLHLRVINSRATRDGEIKFIVDFMSAQNTPRNVIGNLCWDRESQLELQRVLIQKQYHYGSFPEIMFDDFYHPHHFTILVDTDCYLEQLLQKAVNNSLVRFPNIWMVFGQFTGKVYIPIYTFFVTPLWNDGGCTIITYYNIHQDDKDFVQTSIGEWSASKGANLKDISIVRDRVNFMGMKLRVTYILTDNDSLNHFTDYREKHIDNYTKINYALYNFICDLLNITQIRLLTDAWGFENPNGSFSRGMFEDLVNDRSDIAGTVSFTPSSRLKYFRYMFAPIKDFSVQFVFRAPSLAYYTNLVVLPFDNLVWLLIGLLGIVCIGLIQIILIWEKTAVIYRQQFIDNKDNSPTILDVVTMQFAIMCQMDFFYEPKSLAGRVATFTVLMAFTFLYTAFSARIVLLLQSNTNAINDLNALYAANFEFGVEKQPYNFYYFKNPSSRVNEHWRRLIYENKVKQPTGDRFLDAVDGIKLVQDSYFAFHIEQTVANYLIDRSFTNDQKCALKFIDTIYKALVPHLPCPRNSPWIEFFAVSFLKLQETGLHSREYRRSFNKKSTCSGRTNVFVSVGLVESYFAFLAFGCGIGISIALLFFENIAYRITF